MTSKTQYLGDLRTEAIHINSKNQIITDAPTDNQGKGEAFSPTDLVATALGSCMLTIMGIKARDMDVDIANTHIDIQKIMGTEPRRITEVVLDINVKSSKQLDEKQKTILERAALNCPVAKSLSEELKQTVKFNY